MISLHLKLSDMGCYPSSEEKHKHSKFKFDRSQDIFMEHMNEEERQEFMELLAMEKEQENNMPRFHSINRKFYERLNRYFQPKDKAFIQHPYNRSYVCFRAR